jgi:hypothetical protein
MNQAILQRRSAAAPLIDLSPFDFNEMARQALQPWSDAYETWRAGISGLVDRPQARGPAGDHDRSQRRHRHDHNHHHDCHCSLCEPDPCACRCCVTDADLVVETKVGERRVITLVVENHWRRERDIELELSSWTRTLHGVEVKAEILTPAAFRLAPCGEAQVVLGVTISPAQAEGGSGAATANPDPSNSGRDTVAGREIPDIDGCAVSYADLRIKGCDLRSIRIAVAVLPRDCDAYVVDCACGCC